MFCSTCGRAIPEGAAFCLQCGRPTGVAAARSGVAGRVAASGPPAAPPVAVATATAAPFPQLYFAGFWLRFVAYLIDSVILTVGCGLLVVILIFATGFVAVLRNAAERSSPDDVLTGTIVLAMVMFAFGLIAITWVYYAWMESSASQGTVGKMALGLIVTDMQCQRVSFARATARYFSKIISYPFTIGIGYLMAGFTAKKQALHDMIASCLVLRKI